MIRTEIKMINKCKRTTKNINNKEQKKFKEGEERLEEIIKNKRNQKRKY